MRKGIRKSKNSWRKEAIFNQIKINKIMLKGILRVIIALIFIASGFVKAVDVKGFSFKLEEYFSPSVFNMPFLEEKALPIAIFVVVLELLLGFMLLLKIRLKFTLSALIALCVFFAFLTFYSAYFNKVTDCGCFGDAIKFTPWQSFTKDIVLLLGLLIIYALYRNSFTKLLPKNPKKYILISVFAVVMGMVILHGILHEPLIDFRAYKIGTDMNAERKKIASDPDVYKTFYVLKNKKTGEEKKVNQDDYVNDKTLWDEGTPWEIQNDKTSSEVVKKGYSSEISKFRLEDENGNDVTEQILSLPKVHLFFTYKPKEVSEQEFAQMDKYPTANVPKYGISPDKKTFGILPNLTMDATPIKTIARSNPFVLTLQNGKIVEKQSLQDFITK